MSQLVTKDDIICAHITERTANNQHALMIAKDVYGMNIKMEKHMGIAGSVIEQASAGKKWATGLAKK